MGTLKDLLVSIVAGDNTLSGDFVVTVFLNGVATALTVTYPAGTDGDLSITTDIAVSANDKFSFVMDATAAGAGSVTSIQMSSRFIPS